MLIARRRADDGPEVIEPGFEWQFPQGGVEPNEDLLVAARRELAEETGVTTIRELGRLPEPIVYDWPPYHGPPHPLTRWRGQSQHWFAFRFVGEESEIDLARAPLGEAPEFDQWRWERLERTPDLVVSYKRHVYGRLVEAFAPFSRPIRPARDSGRRGRRP